MNFDRIPGLGPKNITLLHKLNLYTIEDLLSFYPFRYDILKRSDVDLLEEDDKIIMDGMIEKEPTLFHVKRNFNKMNFRIANQDQLFQVIIYNRAFMKQHLKAGIWVCVTGKYSKKKNTITASTLELGKLEEKPIIRGVYHTVNGLSNKILLKYIDWCLENGLEEMSDDIPEYFQERYHFLDKKSALYNIHHPNTMDLLKQSLIRLKYEELFVFMLKMNYLQMRSRKENLGIARSLKEEDLIPFFDLLPFTLTNDQKGTIFEVLHDMNQKREMNRLIQGDVGSGKTMVAIAAMYLNTLSGYQSAMMAPTEILALQHYQNVKKLLGNFHVEILLGSTKQKEKKRILEALQNGSIDILIGTHALIQENITYASLGLVITDEQHRFGVRQRGNLKNKGKNPDVLYMSATPIPRTYALTIYGDMDVSSIKTMPNGRKRVETFLKTNSEMKQVLEMMYEELKQHHQIFVVAPLIEESDKSNLENVVQLKEKMTNAFGKYFTVDLLHGKMKNDEKEEIMKRFQKNESQILISTTVIEVGVDVPNATMMVIFNAERFGLSTLHQLRGRVGRNDLPCKCILISDFEKERLKIMTEVYDGFVISEADFKLRGHGDLFGKRQSGDMTFKIADIKNDFKILLQAKKDAQEYLENHTLNPHLEQLLSSLQKYQNLD